MRLCKKRIAAVLLAFLLFCSSCLQAFADDTGETAENQTTQEDTIVEEVPESEETPAPTDEEQKVEETEESQEPEETVEDPAETVTILTFSLTSAKPEITEGQTEYTFEGIHVGMRRAEDETAGVSIFEFAEDGSSTSLEVEPGSYILYTICGNSSYEMPEEETTVELQPGAQEIKKKDALISRIAASKASKTQLTRGKKCTWRFRSSTGSRSWKRAPIIRFPTKTTLRSERPVSASKALASIILAL